MLGLGTLAGVVCLVLGFILGQNQTLLSNLSLAVGLAQPDNVQRSIDALESDLIDAQLSAEVQRAAAQTLRKDLTKMRQQSQQLQEEVSLYKSLMEPGSVVNGLQVTKLELNNSAEPRKFSFELLLTQIAERRADISGEVRLDVIGRELDSTAPSAAEEDAEIVLSLTEVSEVESYPLPFKFRYFQDLYGELTLPEDFLPSRVLVTAQQDGKDALEESFPWPG